MRIHKVCGQDFCNRCHRRLERDDSQLPFGNCIDPSLTISRCLQGSSRPIVVKFADNSSKAIRPVRPKLNGPESFTGRMYPPLQPMPLPITDDRLLFHPYSHFNQFHIQQQQPSYNGNHFPVQQRYFLPTNPGTSAVSSSGGGGVGMQQQQGGGREEEDDMQTHSRPPEGN